MNYEHFGVGVLTGAVSGLLLGWFLFGKERPHPNDGQLAEEVRQLRADLEAVDSEKLAEGQFLIAYKMMGEENFSGAIDALNRALRHRPDDPAILINRGNCHQGLRQWSLALADYRRAAEIQPDNWIALNNQADLLASAPDDDLRDGGEAVRLATKAVEQTESRIPGVLETLAAAQAESGEFETAIQTQRQAIELAPASQRPQMEKKLETLQQHQPLRIRRSP